MASLRGNDRQREAGARLLQEFLTLYGSCRITAKQLCVLCHMCDEAGVPGATWSMYSRSADLQSGKYQHHLDCVMPAPKHLIHISVPISENHSTLRSVRDHPVKLFYESLSDELAGDPSILEALRARPDQREPNILDVPAYTEHPATKQARDSERDPPLPLAVYLDGVRYQQQAAGRSDTVTGWWVVNLVSGRRHLVATMKHSDECACGCRGWCSVHPIMDCIRWQLQALQDGTRPQLRYDGGDWECGTNLSDLSFRACLLYIKGDWMEHCRSLALSNYGQYHHSCQFCKSVKSELDSTDGMETLDSFVFDLRTNEEYEEACRRCEINVEIRTQAQLRFLKQNLVWLKNLPKIGGRGIARDVVVAGVQLKSGDRLEPNTHVRDIGDVLGVKLPAMFTFWRSRYGPFTKLPLDPVQRRCPLFDQRLGTSPVRTLAADAMHTLHLGIVQRLISAVLYRVIFSNPWRFQGTQKVLLDLTFRQL
eukprot:6692252-Pyramimonas_sp.AAC.1